MLIYISIARLDLLLPNILGKAVGNQVVVCKNCLLVKREVCVL